MYRAKDGLGGTCESLAAANIYHHDDLTESEFKGHYIKTNQYRLLNMEKPSIEKFPIV